MSTTAYKIEVMQWHEDGNTVECKSHQSPSSLGRWNEVLKKNPVWAWDHCDYRKKPKPIECWVTVLDGDTASTVHMTKESAEAVLRKNGRWSVRKVVIE